VFWGWEKRLRVSTVGTLVTPPLVMPIVVEDRGIGDEVLETAPPR
jgi:hypothetical protein